MLCSAAKASRYSHAGRTWASWNVAWPTLDHKLDVPLCPIYGTIRTGDPPQLFTATFYFAQTNDSLPENGPFKAACSISLAPYTCQRSEPVWRWHHHDAEADEMEEDTSDLPLRRALKTHEFVLVGVASLRGEREGELM